MRRGLEERTGIMIGTGDGTGPPKKDRSVVILRQVCYQERTQDSLKGGGGDIFSRFSGQ